MTGLREKAQTYTHAIFDAIVNTLSGAGGAGDPNTRSHAAHVEVSYEEALTLYRHYWLARKVIDIPVADMMKNGRTFVDMSPEDEKRYRARWTELQADARMVSALKWASLVGGGVIVGTNPDMDMAEPLRLDDVANGGLTRLLVFDAKAFSARHDSHLVADLTKRTFGMPEMFTHKGLPIDPSHMIVARGMEQPNPDHFHVNMAVHPWFGSSRLQFLKEPIIQAHANYDNMAAMVLSNNMDVLRVPGLYDMITACATPEEHSEMGTVIMRRVQMMAAHKSMHNVAVIDSEESLDRMRYDLTAMPQIIRESIVAVGAGADIPLTRFAGVSPGGLNTTGEGDLHNYYDGLGGRQNEECRPLYDGLDELVTTDVFGEPRALEYTINSPNTETSGEVLERESKTAEYIAKLADITGIPESVILEKLRDTILPTIPEKRIKDLKAEEDTDPDDDPDD